MIQPIILAAGQGTRMRSNLPKVLHCLAGKPIIEHVLCTVQHILPTVQPIVIFGHQGQKLQEALGHYELDWVEQKEQLGTGHAVLQASHLIPNDQQVLILYGDVPLISEQTLTNFIAMTPKDAVGVLTTCLENPFGYGRIKRNAKGDMVSIVEEKDASAEEKQIQEINSGIYLIPSKNLHQWLGELKSSNAQGEYYLTDIIDFAVRDQVAVQTFECHFPEEVAGVNNKQQLMDLERFYQEQYAKKLLAQGVTLYDAKRFDVRGELDVGVDVIIDVNVIIEGKVSIGNGCIIGPNTLLRNVHLGENVIIKANTIVDGAEIANNAVVGPFARIRPGTVLAPDTRVGNFVEIKNSQIGTGSKINHLSYIGDTTMGQQVNVGAGTITCNYDGANKHRTQIDDGVHIGSDTQLVAPVKIGANVTIAAGSTVVKDVEPNQLVLTHRLEQRGIKDWKRPEKVAK